MPIPVDLLPSVKFNKEMFEAVYECSLRERKWPEIAGVGKT